MWVDFYGSLAGGVMTTPTNGVKYIVGNAKSAYPSDTAYGDLNNIRLNMYGATDPSAEKKGLMKSAFNWLANKFV